MRSLARRFAPTPLRVSLLVALGACPACSLFVDLEELGAGGGAEAADGSAGEEGPGPSPAVRGDDEGGSPPEAAPGDAGVDAPPSVVIARDDFEREVTNGFGAARAGGAWSTGGAAATFSVAAGRGVIRVIDAGLNQSAHLEEVLAVQPDVTVRLAADKVGSGSGLYLSVHDRVVGTANYATNLIVRVDGSVDLQLARRFSPAADSVVLGSRPKLTTLAPGEGLVVRTQLEGISPTVLRTKVWRDGQPEPSTWLLETTDATPELQVPGFVGMNVYLSSTATNLPLVVTYDDFVVRDRPLGR